MGNSKRKPVVSTRLPEDTKDRFDDFRDDRGINQADALRRVVKVGLDTIEEQEREMQRNARTQTPAEQWCHDKFQSWTGLALLLGVGFTVTFVAFLAVTFTSIAVPEWPIALTLFAFLAGFIIFGGGGLVTYVAVRTGLARDLEQRWGAGDHDEVGA